MKFAMRLLETAVAVHVTTSGAIGRRGDTHLRIEREARKLADIDDFRRSAEPDDAVRQRERINETWRGAGWIAALLRVA